MKKLRTAIIYFIAVNLLVLGIDKFFKFMPEACTLMEGASINLLYGFGVLEILFGIFLFLGKFTKSILVLVLLLMCSAIYMHLRAGTNDIGGAVFLGVVSLIPLIIRDR